jgi:hypothetical protein
VVAERPEFLRHAAVPSDLVRGSPVNAILWLATPAAFRKVDVPPEFDTPEPLAERVRSGLRDHTISLIISSLPHDLVGQIDSALASAVERRTKGWSKRR